jgi:hypothetical protein
MLAKTLDQRLFEVHRKKMIGYGNTNTFINHDGMRECEDIYMNCTSRYTLKGAHMHNPYPSTQLWSVLADVSK